MHIRNPLPRSVPTLVVAALSLAHSAIADETIVGRVHDRAGSHVQVCFDDSAAAAAIGAEYRVVRHTISAPGKSPAALRSQNVGAVRVDETGRDHCAKAMVISGDVRALDWIERGDK